jgi:hypothetical protein
LAKDGDIQDIVALNLIRVFQFCVDVDAHPNSDSEFPPPDNRGKVFYYVELSQCHQWRIGITHEKGGRSSQSGCP